MKRKQLNNHDKELLLALYQNYCRKIKLLYTNLKHDIMELDKVYEKFDELKKTLKNEILKLHPHPIKQMSGSDKRWYTYYYCEENKRNVIKKNSEEEIFQALLKLYHLEEEPRTLKTLYGEYLEFKAMRLPKESGTVHRIDCEYRKYYADDEIIDIPISKLSKEYIETWAYKLIRKYQLKKKQYYNLITILKGTLEYAVYMRYIPKNPYDGVKNKHKDFQAGFKTKIKHTSIPR